MTSSAIETEMQRRYMVVLEGALAEPLSDRQLGVHRSPLSR